MLRGIVKYYNREKFFGFVVPADGRKVFFSRFAGGQILIEDGLAMIGSCWSQLELDVPKPGDELVLEVERGKKGYEATCWGYAKAYDEAVASLPEVRAMRLLTVCEGRRQLTFRPEECWRGRDLRELDKLIGIELRPSSRTGKSSAGLHGSQKQTHYRLERLVRGRWRRYETPPATTLTQASAQDTILAAA